MPEQFQNPIEKSPSQIYLI